MKLKYDNLLSSFAFKFNLRHYGLVCAVGTLSVSDILGHIINVVSGELELERAGSKYFDGDLDADDGEHDVWATMTVRELTCSIPLRAWAPESVQSKRWGGAG